MTVDEDRLEKAQSDFARAAEHLIECARALVDAEADVYGKLRSRVIEQLAANMGDAGFAAAVARVCEFFPMHERRVRDKLGERT
jgi:hypothetical protein